MENLDGVINEKIEKEITRIATNLVLSKMNKEDIQKLADKAFQNCTERKSNDYWDTKKSVSKIENEVLNTFYGDVQNEVNKIRETEEYQKKVREEAEYILEDLKKKVHENLINNIASQLSLHSIDPYGNVFDLKVQEIFSRMIGNGHY